MEFKKFLVRKLVPAYFMIVTFINLAAVVLGSVFFPRSTFTYAQFSAPLIFGAIGCLPLLVEYLLRRWVFSGKSQGMWALWLEAAGELVLVELCVVGGSAVLKGFDSPLNAAVMAAMVLAIFAAVTAVEYAQDNKMCREMNQAISSMRK